MRHKLITALPLVFIFLSSLLAIKALMHPGFYTSHDGWHIVARLHHFSRALYDGQFPPRWSGELLYGFGYPLFLFSYHFPWWIGSVFLLFGFTIFDSLKVLFILSYIISGIVMYLFVKDLWGRLPAIGASFLYLFTPYRFATILVRANMGEAVSFATVPLIFWAIYLLFRKKRIAGFLLGAVGLAGSLLSHIMVVILYLVPLTAFFTILLISLPKKDKRPFIRDNLIIGLLGLGLSAYYLLPALYYRPLTVFGELYRHLYKSHFTQFSDLLYSPWGYAAIGQPGEMSRQVGLIIWVVVAVSFIVFLYKAYQRQLKIQDKIGAVLIFCIFTAVFLMVKESQSVWSILEKWTTIDFPWRFLSVTTICGSLLGGYLIYSTPKWRSVLVFLLVVGAFYTNRNHLRVNQYTDIPLSLYIASERTSNTDDEYLPTWVSRDTVNRENETRIRGELEVENLSQNSREIYFNYDAVVPATTLFHHMFFPGMTLLVDNISVSIEESENGIIKGVLPAGRHEAKLVYKPTSIMKIGNVISLASLVVWLGILYRQKRYF